MTASNFGKVGISDVHNYEPGDILATVQGLVGEVITTLSIQLAEHHHAEHIVYIGSTLTDNEQLKRVIEHYTVLKKHKPVSLQDYGYCGAVGALLNMMEYSKNK